jgi:hypothetical protein
LRADYGEVPEAHLAATLSPLIRLLVLMFTQKRLRLLQKDEYYSLLFERVAIVNVIVEEVAIVWLLLAAMWSKEGRERARSDRVAVEREEVLIHY